MGRSGKIIDLIITIFRRLFGDITTLQSDVNNLIRYVQERCPNARIILIGQYWKNGTIDAIKQQICQDGGKR